MSDFNKILLLFLFLAILISPALAAEQVNITYIGISDPTSLSIEALSTNDNPLIGSLALPTAYQIVNYQYISWVDEPSKLAAFVEGADVKSQDIIVFDMYYAGDMETIYQKLKDNLEAGTKVIGVRGAADPLNIFDVSDDADLESLLTTKFYTDSTTAIAFREGRSMKFLFLTHLMGSYAPESKVEHLDFDKLNVLYVGYGIPSPEVAYAGTFEFNYFISNLQKTPYRHFFDKMDVVSYGDVSEIDTQGNITQTNPGWYSYANLQSNMTGINLDDYHLIILDGFSDQAMFTEFDPLIQDAKDKGIVVYAHNRNGVATVPHDYVKFSRFSYQNPFVLLSGQNYDGKDGVVSFIGIFNTGLNFPNFQYVSGFASAASARLTYPAGDFFHPTANEYFKDVEEYKDWYETSAYYTPGAPYVGIFGFINYQQSMKEMTSILEAKGYNVVCAASVSEVAFYNKMDEFFIDSSGKPHVEVLISMKNWAMHYQDQQEGVRQLEELGVPVIKVVGSDSGGKYDVNSGISEGTFSWMASSSNVDGMIDFIALTDENMEWIADRAIAWAELRSKSSAAKNIAIMYYNYPPGKAEVGANYLNVMRSLAGDGAKNFVSNPDASITNPNYGGILRELKGSGGGPDTYDVRFDRLPLVTIGSGGEFVFDYTETNESLIMNEVNLINLIYAQGINVGTYAPGVLDTMVQQRINYINDDNSSHTAATWWGSELIPVKDYLDWLEHETTPKNEMTSKGVPGNGTMDISLYNDLIQTWGTPTIDGAIPTNTSEFEAWGGMIWKDADGEINPGAPGMNYIVIPMIKFGNVRIMPEPNRALASDKAIDSGTYHSGDLPPTHQYVAFYMWTNRGTDETTGVGTGVTGILGGDDRWKADALVHFGTHGTQEWLPGTSVGLKRTQDWGPVLLPSLPNIYPYIVANVGEGLTAEYRGNALIISHMTPPMIKTQLYDSIIEMETAIRGYQKQAALGESAGNAAIMGAYREIIVNYVFKLGWQDAFIDLFNGYKTEIAADKYGGNVSKVTNDDLNEYISKDKDIFDAFLENHLHNFVESIRETSLSYGTHTYGHFDENHIAPMVWNMWSRQGLDDVLLDTYFDDVPSIPTNKNLVLGHDELPESDFDSKYDEDDILRFIELLSTPGLKNAQDIRTALQTAFGETDEAKEDKVIYFLLGPSAYFSDSKHNANGASVVAAWKETEIEGVSVYDSMVEEFFEFYFYFEIPAALRGTGTYQDTLGNSLGDAEMEAAVTAFAQEIITGGDISYGAIEKGLANQFNKGSTGRPWYNDKMTYLVLGNYRIAYADNLRATGVSEMNALKEALNGGYISPSSGNDPVLNPHILPTGRNFYGVDPSTYSTPAAWKVGKAIGEQLLISYYNENGKFPETVSFMRFGVDFIQDEGTLEACLFYLLGTEPTWEYASARFTGAKPVVSGDPNYEDMFKLTFKNNKNQTVEEWRPRVDVVYNSAGMRDGYGSMLRYIDRAVKDVARLSDGADDFRVTNNVKKNVAELSELLKGSGLSDSQIWELATSRVFAQQLGQYEIGTGNLIGASGNFDPNNPDTMKAIADTYLEKMGFLYTEANWGESSDQIKQMLQALLGRTDASIFASAGNLYDSLDNDDVFQYFGAMNKVSSMYDRNGNYISDSSQWKTPQMFIADTSNIHNYKTGNQIVYTASAYIQKDLAARYLNDEWIKGQIEAGYSGAMMYAEVMQNLYGWSVVSNGELIGQETWNRVFEKYQSEDMVNHLSHASPYALQSITGSMLESVRMGYWDASDDQLKQLMQNYVQSVIDAGVACCHHTCGNPTLDKFIAGQMSVLGLTPEEEEKYWKAVEDATEREAPEVSPSGPTNPPSSSSSSSGGGYGTALSVDAGQTSPDNEQSEQNEQRDEAQDSGQSAGVGMNTGVEPGTPITGIEMTVSQLTSSVRDFVSNPSFSSSSMIAIAFVVLAVGAVFYGFRRRGL